MAGRPKGSKNKVEEIEEPVVDNTGSVPEENYIFIEDLPTIKMTVEAEIAEKKLNPSAIQDGEAGLNFIGGEPHMVIDNQYVPLKEAEIILQTRKVVKDWIILENLKKGIKE